MYVQIPLIALLGAGVALAASPDKPGVKPPVPERKLGAELESAWKAPKAEKGYWLPNGIPEGCKYVAQQKGFNPSDFKVFNVKYSDCDQPWVFCRHKNAGATEAQMINKLGQLPVKARSFIRHFIATPKVGNAAGITWGTGDMLVTSDPVHEVLTHEVGHSMDWNALGYTFSNSATWQNAYAKDVATVTDYGRTNWAEDFAESVMVAFYNHDIERGIGKIMPNWRDIRNQKEVAEQYFGKYMAAGGTCGKRMANTKKVPMSDSAKMAAVDGITNDPDTAVTWEGIEEIVIRPEVAELSSEFPEHSH